MKLLVTGASGFMGRNALDLLVKDARWEIHAATRTIPPEGWPSVKWHAADFFDRSSFSRVIKSVRPSHLLNLAWIGGEFRDNRYNSPVNHDWSGATADVVTLFREFGGERVVSSGSCLEYGGSPSPWDERAMTAPDTAYGKGKVAASEAIMAIEGVSAAVGRVFFAYGPYEDRRRLVADVVTSLLLGQKVALSAGDQKRDYLHTRDIGRALISLLADDGEGVYNIGSGQSWPVAHMAREIGRQVGREELLEFGARTIGGDTASDMTAVTDRIRQEIGWAPELDLETGLGDCVAWWREKLKENGEL